MFKPVIIIFCAATILSMHCSAQTLLSQGMWEVYSQDGVVMVSFEGKDVFADIYSEATYRLGQTTGSLDSRDLSVSSTECVNINDPAFGQGKILKMSYTDGRATLTRLLSVYEAYPYMIAQATVTANSGAVIESNRVVALGTTTQTSPMKGTNNKMVWVPFDNDEHDRYRNYNFDREMTSHEVGYVFDAETRHGFVAGSIDHDKWKSGITLCGKSRKNLTRLELLSGYTSKTTRDFDWVSQKIIPHGYVKGTEVASARYLVGFFDDWRKGMNTFAQACTLVCPRAPWDAGNPMGWNSWGVMQENVNFEGVVQTATWIKENLFDKGFYDKYNQTVISLDSFGEGWEISAPELSKLGNKILGEGTYKELGKTKQGLDMRLGLYGGLVVWDWALDTKVPGTGIGSAPEYKWKDCLLTYNGHPHSLVNGGKYLAIDPIHPATKANIDDYLKRWASYGVKYIKMDFITSGICEGDSWYDPEITTGVMAYNYGMKYIYEKASEYGMYIVEGISPLFPYNYAHGRRTCCDRFSELGESEYVMNAMTWSWWTDRLYTVNDPDQLVLFRDNNNKRETIGENRVRASSGLCTGAFIFGDNFSEQCVYTSEDEGHSKGEVVGYPAQARERALVIMGNENINRYVRENTGSFMPLEGSGITSSQQTDYFFVKETAEYFYLAVFNWDRVMTKKGVASFERLGLDPSNAGQILELWSGETTTAAQDGIQYNVPPADVRIYRVRKNHVDGIDGITADPNNLNVRAYGETLEITCSPGLEQVSVYDISGKLITMKNPLGSHIDLVDIGKAQGVYLVKATTSEGSVLSTKVLVK